MPRLLCRVGLALCLLLAAGGCGRSVPRSEPPPLEDVNVLLIIVDALGQNHVGCLTPGLDTTPRIDRLAREGVLFKHAYATAPWTEPAIGSLLTGLMPSRHGVLRLNDVLPARLTTMAEYLKARGFATSGIITNSLIDQAHGYAQGFGHYDETISGDFTVSSPDVARYAGYELDRLKNSRFFLMVHLFDPHFAYMHHPDSDRTKGHAGPVRSWGDLKLKDLLARRGEMGPADVAYLRDLYREEVSFTDHYIGVILDKLASLDLDRSTLVILTADHGEEIMEHGWIGHTRFLYDTLTHVPLIFRLPGKLAPRVVDEPVQSIDVLPTLLAMARQTAPADTAARRLDGVSLLPALRGGRLDPERALFSEVAYADPTGKGGSGAEDEAFLSAVTRGPWRLIHDLRTGAWSLYDRASDPGEKRDVFAPDSPRVRELQPLLTAWEAGKVETWCVAGSESSPMTADDERRLRSLGYTR